MRGRLARRRAADLAERYDRSDVQLYAAALLLARALAAALLTREAPTAGLVVRVRGAAEVAGRLADGLTIEAPAPSAKGAVAPARTPAWAACVEHLNAIDEALRALQEPR